MRYGLMAAGLIVAAAAAAARPAAPAPARPEAFEALVKCRAIAEDAARLRCFDQASGALEQAAARRDVVIIDRAQVRQTKRTLFGLELPRLPFFGGGDDKAEEVTQIDGVIGSAFQNGNGKWVVRLEEGGTWAQTDDSPVAIWPKAGQKVVIKRAAMGSYMMRINGQPGVRAKRQL
ncbi:MAG: hypothetical protein QOH81_876 [Sphingomonadales bacterium]|jgi:hypothetical protein|nr:hypothetical protein [Sphingomonadales bacterium]